MLKRRDICWTLAKSVAPFKEIDAPVSNLSSNIELLATTVGSRFKVERGL